MFMKKIFIGIILFFSLFSTPQVAQAALPPNFFGVMTQEPVSLSDSLKMASGGITAYRIPMSWDAVQASSSSGFNWAGMDSTMRQISLARIRGLPIMMGTPAGFASKYTVFPIYTAEQRQGWATYLREAIKRYGPRGTFWKENPDLPYLPIRTWQVWNEANFFYFAEPVSAVNYVRLLKMSYRIIKSQDRGARIMLTSLFAEPGDIPRRAEKATTFLNRIYRLGAKNYFHATSFHPYSKDAKEMARMIWEFRKVMNQNNDRRKSIHVTELGWGSGTRTAFDKGTEEAQAQELTVGYNYLLKYQRSLRIGSIYWFSWKDMPESISTCNFCYYSGLFRSGSGPLSAKPAWEALKAITSRYL